MREQTFGLFTEDNERIDYFELVKRLKKYEWANTISIVLDIPRYTNNQNYEVHILDPYRLLEIVLDAREHLTLSIDRDKGLTLVFGELDD